MAHNQMQFQQLIGKSKVILARCKKCGMFARVTYYPGKYTEISCNCRHILFYNADYLHLKSEEAFSLKVAEEWNKKA